MLPARRTVRHDQVARHDGVARRDGGAFGVGNGVPHSQTDSKGVSVGGDASQQEVDHRPTFVDRERTLLQQHLHEERPGDHRHDRLDVDIVAYLAPRERPQWLALLVEELLELGRQPGIVLRRRDHLREKDGERFVRLLVFEVRVHRFQIPDQGACVDQVGVSSAAAHTSSTSASFVGQRR